MGACLWSYLFVRCGVGPVGLVHLALLGDILLFDDDGIEKPRPAVKCATALPVPVKTTSLLTDVERLNFDYHPAAQRLSVAGDFAAVGPRLSEVHNIWQSPASRHDSKFHRNGS